MAAVNVYIVCEVAPPAGGKPTSVGRRNDRTWMVISAAKGVVGDSQEKGGRSSISSSATEKGKTAERQYRGQIPRWCENGGIIVYMPVPSAAVRFPRVYFGGATVARVAKIQRKCGGVDEENGGSSESEEKDNKKGKEEGATK